MNNIYTWFVDDLWWSKYPFSIKESDEVMIADYMKNNTTLAAEDDKKECRDKNSNLNKSLLPIANKLNIPLSMLKNDVDILEEILGTKAINHDEERQKWINIYPIVVEEWLVGKYRKWINEATKLSNMIYKSVYNNSIGSIDNNSKLYYNVSMWGHIQLHYVWEWKWFKTYMIGDLDKTIDIFNEQVVDELEDLEFEIPYQGHAIQLHNNLLLLENTCIQHLKK